MARGGYVVLGNLPTADLLEVLPIYIRTYPQGVLPPIYSTIYDTGT